MLLFAMPLNLLESNQSSSSRESNAEIMITRASSKASGNSGSASSELEPAAHWMLTDRHRAHLASETLAAIRRAQGGSEFEGAFPL